MIVPSWHTRPFCVFLIRGGNPSALTLAEILKKAVVYTFRVHCSARGKSGIDNAFGTGYADEVAGAYLQEHAADLEYPSPLNLLIWPEEAPEQMRHILARSQVAYETELQPFTPPVSGPDL